MIYDDVVVDDIFYFLRHNLVIIFNQIKIKVMKKETMNVTDVVKYFMDRNHDEMYKYTILFFMNASANRNVCDMDGNMSTEFIRKSVSVTGDDSMFREIECEVTTQVPF